MQTRCDYICPLLFLGVGVGVGVGVGLVVGVGVGVGVGVHACALLYSSKSSCNLLPTEC